MLHFLKNWLSANQVFNQHKNQMSCVENDCACKSNEQLLQMLNQVKNSDVIQGIKRVLLSRGFQEKDLPK